MKPNTKWARIPNATWVQSIDDELSVCLPRNGLEEVRIGLRWNNNNQGAPRDKAKTRHFLAPATFDALHLKHMPAL